MAKQVFLCAVSICFLRVAQAVLKLTPVEVIATSRCLVNCVLYQPLICTLEGVARLTLTVGVDSGEWGGAAAAGGEYHFTFGKGAAHAAQANAVATVNLRVLVALKLCVEPQ